ncbi:MAG: hypothetical protein AB7N24_06530 [Dehalococcoidia bacterium]
MFGSQFARIIDLLTLGLAILVGALCGAIVAHGSLEVSASAVVGAVCGAIVAIPIWWFGEKNIAMWRNDN